MDENLTTGMWWKGRPELDAALAVIVARAERTAKEIVMEGAALVERAAKQNFQGKHRPGQPHVGGDRPNVVTGSLRRSIGHERVKLTPTRGYSTRVGPRMIYSRSVELGNPRTNSRPFPYFTPAVETVRPQLQALAARKWAESIRTTPHVNINDGGATIT